MTIKKLVELLQPHSATDADIKLGIWNDDRQGVEMVDIEAIRIVLDADGELMHIALEAE